MSVDAISVEGVERMEKMLVRAALIALAAYRRLVSPVLPRACRYLPTCSDYAAEALRTHGLARGAALAVGRLSRCHPLGGSGLDPVPERPGQNVNPTETEVN